MHIRCPHCHEAIETVGEEISEITCPSCGSAFDLLLPETPWLSFLSKKAIGHFELLEKLGRGGYGTVWKARDTKLDRLVAIKVPRFDRDDPRQAERFLREARAAAQLRHPNIVAVHEVGRTDGTLYIVSDFVQGMTLAERLGIERLTAREAARLLATIADAIYHAHEAGVIHRDLKPQNIMLEELKGGMASGGNGARSSFEQRYSPKVMDFGLAKRESDKVTMTAEGERPGTVLYMSPEQAFGKPDEVDRKSDIYTLGVILYQLLTGELPFRGNANMVLTQIRTEEPRPPRRLNDKIPRDLETICLKAMAKEPGRRYATARELAEDLRRFLSGEPIQARPVGRVEKAWRWCKRNPTVASLTTAVAISLVTGTTIATYFAIEEAKAKRLADINAANALASAKNASEQTNVAIAQKDRADRAVDEATSNLYLWDMGRIQVAWDSNALDRVWELLGKYEQQRVEKDLRGFEWHYWNRLAHSYAMDLRWHAGPVWSVTFSPDGERLASAGADHTVILADAMTGEVLHRLKGHSGQVRSVAFTADGTRLATASDDETIKIWDVSSGEGIRTFKGHTGAVYSVVFDPLSNRLASASTDQSIRICDTSTGELLHTINGKDDLQLPSNVAHSGSIALRGGLLAACMNSGNVTLWSTDSGMPLRTLSHGGSRSDGIRIASVAFDPKQGDLATAGSDQTIRLWDVSGIGAGRELLKITGHTRPVIAVAFSPDGSELITGSDDHTAKVWNARSGKAVRTFKGHANGVTSVAFGAIVRDGKRLPRLASSSADGTVKVWDSISGKGVLWEHDNETAFSLALHPSGTPLTVVGINSVNLDPTTGARTERLRSGKYVTRMAYSPDGKSTAIGSIDGTIMVEKRGAKFESKAHAGQITCIAFHPDSKRFASASADQTVIIWDSETGAKLHPPMRHASPVLRVAFSPDGKRLASAGDLDVRIWDVETGEELAPLTGHTLRSAAVAYNPDGSLVASAGFDQTIKLWDANNGKELRTRAGHSGYIWALAFSPDGKRLASASEDRTVKLWDTASGEAVLTLNGIGNGISDVLFGTDGARLIAAANDGFAFAWDTKRRDDAIVLPRSARAANDETLHAAVTPVLAPRLAAPRLYSMNHLKKIGLALHMYADKSNRLPAQAIRNTDGKALLSWRVAILPFLENEALYKQFRLDEPWDSEHNKPLTEKMPSVFASPALRIEQQHKGLTTYLAPLSRQPMVTAPPPVDSKKSRPTNKGEMVFDRIPGARFAEMTDGTSNTIAVLEANPQSAVIWTKPDDLVIDDSDPMKNLIGQLDGGFYCLFMDGSVKFIRNSLDHGTFRDLLRMDDGHAIGQFLF